jgi:tetratricopeptide (TPR) repeat protein
VVTLNTERDSVDAQLNTIEQSWSYGEREQAEGVSRALEALATRSDSPLKQAAILYRLATRWRRLGEITRAKRLYEFALPLFAGQEERIAQRGAGICSGSLGSIARADGLLDAATTYYRDAATYFEQAEDQPNRVIALNNLGVALEVGGKYQEAEDVLMHAVQLSPNDAAVLGNLALVTFDRFDFNRSRALYEQAMACDDGSDPHRVASHWGGLGNVYRALADYPQACDCYLHALEIHRVHGEKRYEEVALGNLGMVYLALGEFSEAIVALENARQLSHEVGTVQDEVDDLLHLSIVYRELNNFESARERLHVGLQMAHANGLKQESGALLDSLGNLHWALGNQLEAKSCFEQARAISQEIRDLHQQSSSLLNLGSLALEEGNIEKAIRLFDQSLAEARSGNHPVGIAAALLNLGIAWSFQDHSHAERFLIEALGFAKRHGLTDDLYRCHRNLGALYEVKGDLANAITHYRQTIQVLEESRMTLANEEHQRQYFEDKDAPFVRLARLLQQNGDTNGAWMAIEQVRSRAFLTMLGETALTSPKDLDPEWSAAEHRALVRLRGIRASMRIALPREQTKLLETWLNTRKELEHLWKDACTIASEYVALRQGSPINADDLKFCLDN